MLGRPEGRGREGVGGAMCNDQVFKARVAFLSAELSGCGLRALQRPT